VGGRALPPLTPEERERLYPVPPETEGERILLPERHLLDLDHEGARCRALLRALAEAALAYDAAIERAAVWSKPWTEGDALDVLYERWLTLAREALRDDHPR
jgi:hypothetical protein